MYHKNFTPEWNIERFKKIYRCHMFLTVSTALHSGCIRKFLRDKLYACFYTQCISFTRNARSRFCAKLQFYSARGKTTFLSERPRSAARLLRKEWISYKKILEKVKITFLTFSRYAAGAAHGWGECPRFYMACPYDIADRGENRSGFPSISRKIAGDSSPRFS